MGQETNNTQEISIDSFRTAGRDLFPLILDTEKLLQAHGMESVSFVSEVFSTTSRTEQLEIIISTLQQIQNTTEETSDLAETALPCPIVVRQRICYNSAEAWREDNKDVDDGTV